MDIPYNEVLTSNNVLIKDNNHSTSSVWEWKASLSPKSWEKMSHNPVKKIPWPGPTRNKIPRPEINSPTWPDPTQPENILKNVPRPQTGFGPVRSGPGKLRISGYPAGLNFEMAWFFNHWDLPCRENVWSILYLKKVLSLCELVCVMLCERKFEKLQTAQVLYRWF